jgi:hypothetical protein
MGKSVKLHYENRYKNEAKLLESGKEQEEKKL